LRGTTAPLLESTTSNATAWQGAFYDGENLLRDPPAAVF